MNHICHWPGCAKEVPPELWGCKPHWMALPKHLRSRIWATYRLGQEVTKDPSLEYIEAAKDVQKWIAANMPKPIAKEETAPDWTRKCEVCGAKPIVPVTGMCGPCTFGEADTTGGNW